MILSAEQSKCKSRKMKRLSKQAEEDIVKMKSSEAKEARVKWILSEFKKIKKETYKS